MGIGNIGWSGLVLILIVLLLVFGPKKLPDIGKAFGKSLRGFKEATQGMVSDQTEETPVVAATSNTAEADRVKSSKESVPLQADHTDNSIHR